jgi:RNA-binding protein YlmH
VAGALGAGIHLLRMYTEERDSQLVARLKEQAARAMEANEPQYTKFLDPREQKLAAAAAKEQGCDAAFFGTEEPMERRVCAFDGRLWLDSDERSYDWPVLAVEILWNSKFESLSHRDVLGALLALGISRESLGDIYVGEGRAVLFALEGMAQYICANMEKAGRAAVKCTVVQSGFSDLPQAATRQIRDSVQSLRLDAVVAASYNLSREEAARAVRSGLVKLNFEEETRTDHAVEVGALLSLKGMGRARLVSASGQTRRSGRTIVLIDRYL